MPQVARFTQIHLENWRNFSKASANLESRVVAAGPAACGKSNLLDAFRFLHDIARVGGGFQEAVRTRGGVSRLRCLAARQNSGVAIRVRVGGGEDQAAWEYELAFAHSDESEGPVIQRERLSSESSDVFCRPDASDNEDPARLAETYLEQSACNRPFRDLVEVLRSVRYLNIVPALVRGPGRLAARSGDPLGAGLIGQIAETAENTSHARLRRILKALQAVVPQLTDLQIWRDAQGAPHLRARYEHWRQRGAWQTEEQFSDGTLRLIGLLWGALDGNGPLLIEEPELSLDPRMVRSVLDMIGRMTSRSGRQAIFTTHSTELLEANAVEPAEVLLLTPGDEGTEIHAAVELPLIRRVMADGICLAEAIGPELPLVDDRQILLFEEEAAGEG
jgi:predicted ATPase